MKKIYLILGLSFSLSTLNGYSQRIWGNPVGEYAYNPAGAAMNDLGEITSAYYTDYMSATNSPKGILLMGSSPFANDNMGAGFRVVSESGGVLENIMAEATYVYKVQVGRSSKLSFGLSGVYNQIGINTSLVNAQNTNDPILTQGAQSGSWFDTNFGINFYQANKFYIGVATYNLLSNRTNWLLTNFSNRESRLASLTGMYTLDLFSGQGKVETTGVAQAYLPQDKYSFSSVSYDVTSRLIFKKAFWIGSGYANNMVKILCGVYVQNLAIGYAGGIGLGDIATSTYALPKHELFLKLDLDTSKSSRSNANR